MKPRSLKNRTGQKVGDRYIIHKSLDAGGMGTVYVARDEKLQTDVVVKFPRPDLISEPGLRERFQNEISSLISLASDHPNIVQIHDLGEHEEMPYAVMQYLTGGSLREWQQSFKPAKGGNWRRALRWLVDIADALDSVHEAGWIHRDVKPANILFDKRGRAYLADFGISKFTRAKNELEYDYNNVTNPGYGPPGTLSYMAYEMLDGSNQFDEKVDQYALAVSLYEVLSGALPYSGRLHDILDQQKVGKARPLPQVCPFINEPAWQVVKRALSKEASNRYPTCHEFADAFIDALAKDTAVHVVGEPGPDAGTGTTRPEQNAVGPAAPRVDYSTKPATDEFKPKKPGQPGKRERRGEDEADQRREVSPGKERSEKTHAESDQQRPERDKPAEKVPSKAPDRIRYSNVVCPWCWHSFSPADLLWISVHRDLTGDSMIRDEPKRFLPDKFTADCRAIDPLGQVCSQTACPKCHLVIPRTIVDFEPLCVSTIGMPSSGKTCLLAATSWRLRETLKEDFKFLFSDADPALNQNLIHNEQSLFDHRGDVYRPAKTELTGEASGYRTVELGGQDIDFLCPHVFETRPTAQHPNFESADQISFSLCLYDNAGEHFLSGSDSPHNPVTRHLSNSEGILFVFDPSQDSHFRHVCRDCAIDPQFGQDYYPTSRQELVLREAKLRLQRYGKLKPGKKYDKPLIIALNKYDAWAPCFGFQRLPNPWHPGSGDGPAVLDLRAINKQSTKMRRLLAEICPNLVSEAEDLSSHVVYMPTSAFGRRIEGADGVRTGNLRPMWAEVPLLYILSHARRGVIPKHSR